MVQTLIMEGKYNPYIYVSLYLVLIFIIVGNPRLIPICSSLSIMMEREESIGISRGLPTMIFMVHDLIKFMSNFSDLYVSFIITIQPKCRQTVTILGPHIHIFQVYQYFTIYWQYFYLRFEQYHIQHSLKSVSIKDHLRWVKVTGTVPY